ncbi:hypothetical protein BE221DRAFT_188493 [Ostreococcus tauri]|uniref:Uncharacterized protein n=1 Tax=Ostreococcus tauri TaxID=70448 RepID=A0A1Y5IQ54_OSTTA|nr:hypothetical protein BE221DRAFT_188493 [Ostreococcus tauri]
MPPMPPIIDCISNPLTSTSSAASSSSAHRSKSTFRFAGFGSVFATSRSHHSASSFINTTNTDRPVVAYVDFSLLTALCSLSVSA